MVATVRERIREPVGVLYVLQFVSRTPDPGLNVAGTELRDTRRTEQASYDAHDAPVWSISRSDANP